MPNSYARMRLLSALAVGLKRFPDSARSQLALQQPLKDPKVFVPPKLRKPNTTGLNRKARRRLEHMATHPGPDRVVALKELSHTPTKI